MKEIERKNSNKRYDQYKRNKDSTKFYNSTVWRKVRLIALNRDNHLCVHCYSKGLFKRADVVDHIIPLQINYSLSLNVNNLQSLCHFCHNKKTKQDLKKYFN